jgi:hypothetical protein
MKNSNPPNNKYVATHCCVRNFWLSFWEEKTASVEEEAYRGGRKIFLPSAV